MARGMKNATSGRSAASSAVSRSARSGVARNIDTGRYETVELKTRGKTVKVSPAAARVLRAAEELRVNVSKDWKQ